VRQDRHHHAVQPALCRRGDGVGFDVQGHALAAGIHGAQRNPISTDQPVRSRAQGYGRSADGDFTADNLGGGGLGADLKGGLGAGANTQDF